MPGKKKDRGYDRRMRKNNPTAATSNNPETVKAKQPDLQVGNLSMAQNHLEKIILDYVGSDSPNNYALMIDGEWGSGKTFYFKESIKGKIEALGKKVYYISLNGLKSPSEIFNELVAERFKAVEFFKKNKIGKIAFGALKSATAIATNALKFAIGETEIDPKSGDLPSVALSEIVSFSKDEHVLCFDDLERASKEFNVPDILGFLNSNFIEHEGLKVIIICNEAEIIKKGAKGYKKEEKDGEETYHRIKEKVVGRTLKYAPQIKDVINSILSLYEKQEGFYAFLQSNTDYIIDNIVRSKQRNLRSLIFFLDNLSQIFKTGDQELLNRFSKEVILANLMFSLEYKSGNFEQFPTKEDLPQTIFNLREIESPIPSISSLIINDEDVTDEMKAKWEKNKEVEKYETILKEKYLQGNKYFYISSLFNFIKSGHLDIEAFNQELRKQIPEDQPPHILTLNKMRKVYGLTDEEFNTEYEQLKIFIQEGSYSLSDFIAASKILHDLSLNGIIEEFPKDELNKFLLDYIDLTINKTSSTDFVNINQELGFRTFQFNESPDLLKRIYEIQDAIKSEEKEIKVDQNLQRFKSDDYMAIHIEDFRDIIIYHSLKSIQEVITAIIQTNVSRLSQFVDMLNDSYQVGGGNKTTVIPREAKKLEAIHEWSKALNDGISQKEKPLTSFFVGSLFKRLEAIVQNLEVREDRVARI